MPNVVVALLVLVPTLVAGTGLTGLAGLPLRLEERVAIGVPLGALVVGLLGWVLGIPFGVTIGSVTGALLLAVACSLPGWWRLADLRGDAADVVRRVRLPWRQSESLRPLVAILAVAWPVTVRIMSLAWVTQPDGGLAAGHLSTWADGAAHLAYAGRMVVAGTPPDSPIAAGQPARYHLLADFFAGQVSVLGIGLPSALAITSGFLALAVPAILYLCGVRLVASRGAAALGTVVFLAGGSLGSWRLWGDVADGGWSALVHLPREYARDPNSGLWMDNPTLSYLYAQRNGLFGLPLALVVFTLVWTAVRGRSSRESAAPLTAAGVLVGLLPLANGFAYLVSLAVVGSWAVLFARNHRWERFFAPAVILGAPVAWWLQPPKSSVRWHVGWMAPDGIDGWLWFWGRNLGPFIVLLAVAGLWRGTVRNGFATWFWPLWLLWIVPNLIAFHPWDWNNTKYFAFWQLVGAFLVGALLVRVWRWGRVGAGAVVVALVLLCSSGALDLYRATDRSVTLIPWASADGLAVAEWVHDTVPVDAVLVTAPTNVNPVTSLSGRRVVSGFRGWNFDMGVPDWGQRVDDSITVLHGGDAALDVIRRRHVDYVVVGPLERGPEFGVDEAWWAANGRLVFAVGDWRVYAAPR
jgi:hypothetical protein